MKARHLTLLLATILFCTAACSKTRNLAGDWKMGGPYNVGKPCDIVQDGEVLTFVNEYGDKSKGFLKDSTTVVAADWEGGLQGVLADSGTRINWKNGTWWLKEK